MENTILYQREIPVKYEAQVCVVGGGPAGVAAAVTAARAGADVFLIEGQGFFGGAASGALVPAFMPFDNGVDFLAGGIGREIYDQCVAVDPVLKMGSTIGIEVEALKRIYDDMVEKARVRYLFFANLIDAKVEDGRIDHLVVAAKSGVYAVKAQLYIDATGDGDLCAMAGAPWEMGDENGVPMPATLCSLWYGVDWDAAYPHPGGQAGQLERAIGDGVFTQEDRHLPGLFRTGRVTGGGNIGHAYHVDATREEDLTRAMVDGRRMLPQYQRYYNDYVQGPFAGAKPIVTGSQLGVRESRRILGDYVLSFEDYMARATFEDEIGRFSYPIDSHPADTSRAAYEAFLKDHHGLAYERGESYGIPYRSLLPRGIANAWVAGRSLSCDHKMQSSIRVMPACYITGQACGMAAALCLENGVGPRGVEVRALQSRLKAMGAFLPNFSE
jgi:hypothetical protein